MLKELYFIIYTHLSTLQGNHINIIRVPILTFPSRAPRGKLFFFSEQGKSYKRTDLEQENKWVGASVGYSVADKK